MVRYTVIFFLFTTGIILTSCSDTDNELELIEIHGALRQWEPVTLIFHLSEIPDEKHQTLSSKKFFYGILQHIDEETLVHGYFSGKHTIKTDKLFNNTWKISFTPGNYGVWTYKVIMTEDLITTAEELRKYLKSVKPVVYSGTLKIIPSEGKKDSFRSSGLIKYSNKGFLINNNDDGRYILNCISVDGTWLDQYTDLNKSYFDNLNDSEKARSLLIHDTIRLASYSSSVIQSGTKHKTNYPGLNGIKLSTSGILSDLTSIEISQANLDNINNMQVCIENLNQLGTITIFELLDFNSDKIEIEALDDDMMIYLREIIARFSYNTGLIWTLGTSGNLDKKGQVIKDITKFVREMDSYDHPILIGCGPNDILLKTFTGYPFIDGIIMENILGYSINKLFMIKNISARKGRKWILLVDEKSVNISDNIHGTIWTRILAGGSGLIWNLQSNPVNQLDFEALNSNFSLMEKINYINNRFDIPYDSEIISDSLKSDKNFGVKSGNAFFMTYLSDKVSYHIDSLSSGSYSISWINLSTDSIHVQSDTTFLNPYNNLILTSPETVISSNWISIVQKDQQMK